MSRWNRKTYTYQGVTRSVVEWAEITGIKYSTIIQRIRIGITEEHMFDKEMKRRKYKRRLVRLGNPNHMPYTWSVSAVDCYELGCNCSKCNIIPQDMKKECQMKETVLELVRRYGKPERTNDEVGKI